MVLIDQRRCKYIKTIAECHSISKAAELLYISQPSLSRLVKKLEDELGIALFDRNCIPLRVTEAGQKYLKYIDQFQKIDMCMRKDFQNLNVESINKLTIATLPFLGTYILPKIVPHFVNLYPSIDLQVQEISSEAVIPTLDNDQADIVLTNIKPVHKTFTTNKLSGDHIMLVSKYNEKFQQLFPDQHSTPLKPLKANLSFLQNETLIILRPYQNMRKAADIICRHFSFNPAKVIEAPSLTTAMSLVECNKGITFITQSSIACIQPESSLIYFSLGEMENLTLILAVYKKERKNILINNFCECAIKALSCVS